MDLLEHAPDLLLVQVLLETRDSERIQLRPPLEEHRLADELEPGRELQTGVFEELLELLSGDVLRVSHFVLVDVQIDVRLNEEDVVDCLSRTVYSD